MSAEENKTLVRHWFAQLDQRNFSVIDELLPDNYVDHNPPLPDMPPGREGVWQASLALAAAFPDAVHTIDDQMAEGDKVMTRLTVRATFLGEIRGFQPTGKIVEVSGIAVHRIAGGATRRALGAHGHGWLHATAWQSYRRGCVDLAVLHQPLQGRLHIPLLRRLQCPVSLACE